MCCFVLTSMWPGAAIARQRIRLQLCRVRYRPHLTVSIWREKHDTEDPWIFLAFVAALSAGSAQAFPDRPIKLIVPTPAGGPPDVAARLLSDKMAADLGQPVIVENRTGGAAGMVGVKSVLTAEPDGYTLLVGSTSTLLIAPLIYKNAGYNAGNVCAGRAGHR